MPKRRTGVFVDSLNSGALSLANSPILQEINENIFFSYKNRCKVMQNSSLNAQVLTQDLVIECCHKFNLDISDY